MRYDTARDLRSSRRSGRNPIRARRGVAAALSAAQLELEPDAAREHVLTGRAECGDLRVRGRGRRTEREPEQGAREEIRLLLHEPPAKPAE